MDLSPEALRAQFAATTAQAAEIEAALEPLRAELADLVAGNSDLSLRAAQAREADLRARIKALMEQAFPIEQDRAALCRALGGKTSG